MFTEPTTYRPRNGEPAEAYWRVRLWCAVHGFHFSDVINAIMIPLAFHLSNHCKIDKRRNLAMVDLTIGTIPILHVIHGKLYPLRRDVDGSKDHLSIEEIQRRITHWEKHNEDSPSEVDGVLKDVAHTS